MDFINSIILEGNVVRDPVIKTTERGVSGCFFSIASDRRYQKNNEPFTETSFFSVETWGLLADECAQNCTHGKFVRIIGRLKQDRWVDPDGKTKTKIKIIAEHVLARAGNKKETTGTTSVTEPVISSETEDQEMEPMAVSF